MNDAAQQKEALRQQMLLRALWHDAPAGVVGGWMRDGVRFGRGLQAYRANAGALAERALGAAFPTLAELLGATSFATLARSFWRAAPPERGDIAEWGAGLGAHIAAEALLADEPYLADVARLEWAVHCADRAADAPAAPAGLERLADVDPQALTLVLRPGTALVSSPHPIATLWLAHRREGADRFAPVRAAFAAGSGEHALVARRGWRVDVRAIAAPAASFTASVLAGRSLAAALADAGERFDFESWLIGALQDGTVTAVLENPS